MESNHSGFDNDSDASFAPRLDAVLFSFTALYLWSSLIPRFMNLPSTVLINKMLQTNHIVCLLIYLFIYF